MAIMGRKRKHNLDMPARCYLSKGWWFFAPKDAPWVKLAREDDKPGALRAYAGLMDALPTAGTVAELLDRYARDVLPSKAPKTVKDQTRQLDVLRRVFGQMPLASVKPQHIAQYLDTHPAKVSANRERALLSHAYTKAIRWGLCASNPCKGVERNTEKPRTRYVEHDEFLAVLEGAPAVVQVMMALAYLTGQREGDLLKLKRASVTSEGIRFQQGKTGKKLIVSWSPALAWTMEQAQKLSGNVASFWVVCKADGQPFTEDGFRTAWQKHIRKCHAEGRIAERYTFHDVRAKAGSDAKDGRLLGHMNPAMLARVYERKAKTFAPTN